MAMPEALRLAVLFKAEVRTWATNARQFSSSRLKRGSHIFTSFLC